MSNNVIDLIEELLKLINLIATTSIKNKEKYIVRLTRKQARLFRNLERLKNKRRNPLSEESYLLLKSQIESLIQNTIEELNK